MHSIILFLINQGGAKGPGIFFIIPCTDSYQKVDLRTVSFDVPPQEVIVILSYMKCRMVEYFADIKTISLSLKNESRKILLKWSEIRADAFRKFSLDFTSVTSLRFYRETRWPWALMPSSTTGSQTQPWPQTISKITGNQQAREEGLKVMTIFKTIFLIDFKTWWF